MKARLTFATLFFAVCFDMLHAQDYSPVISNNTSLFLTSTGTIEALHVDSFTTEQTGISFHFMKTLPMGEGCYSTFYLPTWAGPKLFVAGFTTYLFNQNNDTITILPLKGINDPWTLYKYTDGKYVEAHVSLKEQLTFLGLTDSVKTIALQLKDSGGNDVSDPINSLTIQLSKNYGLVKGIAFLDFPDISADYTLTGMSNPKVGTQILTDRMIYNFDIGDEFHYRGSYCPNYNDCYDTKTINKITGKYISANTDTVVYSINQFKETIDYNYPAHTTTDNYTVNQITQSYTLTDSIIYPNIYFSTDSINGVHFALQPSTDPGPTGRLVSLMYQYGGLYRYHDTCWLSLVDGPAYSFSYLEGCGIYIRDQDGAILPNNERLEYYKKGNETWGQPLVLATLSKSSNNSVQFYPNPLKQGEELQLNSGDFNPSQLTVYNSVGNKVYESMDLISGVQNINLSQLQQGLYVIQLVNKKNEFTTSKLIIK